MGKYSLGAIVRMKRYSIHISQEKISDGICSVETMSRMENGKQVPLKSNYELLMERMGSSKIRAYSMLTVADFDILERMKEFEDYIQLFEYKKADEILPLLERIQDKTLFDKQFLERARAIVDYRLKRITIEEFIAKLDNAIRITIPQFDEVNLNIWPFNRQEALTIINMASGYAESGNIERAIALFNNVINSLNQGYMDKQQYSIIQVSVLTNLSKCLGLTGRHDKAIEVAEEGIKLCRSEKIGSSLALLFYNVAWNIRNKMEKGNAEKEQEVKYYQYLKMSLYISKAMNQNLIKDLVHAHCEQYNIKFTNMFE